MIVFAIVCIPATVAYASAPGDAEQTTPPAATEQTEPTADTTEPTEPEDVTPAALTPEGNLTLVDDIEGEQSKDKQFFTVITKSGNYFYLVIDRAGDTENVHFLNLVDESDLLALIEDTQPAPAATAPVATAPESTPTEAVEPEPMPEPEESSLNISAILAAIVVAALAGGGALFYVKVLKPKRKAAATGEIDLDGFDFGDEDEDMPYGTHDRDYTEPDIDTDDISKPGDSTGRYEAANTEFATGDEPETEETK